MGNVLRGDDGFGVVVAQALADGRPLGEGVQVMEVGIGGIHLVQALMAGFDVLVVVDAV
ncbi:MAG: hydrogenase maturation protease, partial [Geodermatophilaceae bacterium]|nr:hydrogenase maturation protease [Geodermatophilaceae bacterium]